LLKAKRSKKKQHFNKGPPFATKEGTKGGKDQSKMGKNQRKIREGEGKNKEVWGEKNSEGRRNRPHL